MTGGVGKDERAKIEKMSGDYELKIVLAAPSGSYLAQIPITIYDSNGTQVFKAEAAGPCFMPVCRKVAILSRLITREKERKNGAYE